MSDVGFPLLYESIFGETRDVTVYQATGNFKFEVLETVGEESPAGGPAAPRTRFAAGESVYVHYRVRNDGTLKTKATIVVKDKDTGATLATYMTPDVDPGWRYEVFKATVGKMPNHDWHLQFVMTP